VRVIVDGLNGCDPAANVRVNSLGKAAAGCNQRRYAHRYLFSRRAHLISHRRA